jgi:hypothetical protein
MEHFLSDSGTDEVADIPGYANYLIFTDESGTHGATHYGFGSLWLPTERRGDLQRIVQEMRAKHRLHSDEIKWNNINRGNEGFYLDLIRFFFTHRWLMFHALVVRKGYVNKKMHDGDYDLARRKHFTMLIQRKIAFFARGTINKAYHVRVDPLPSRYQKADEAACKIANYMLKQEIGIQAIQSLLTRSSKLTLGIQLSDLLLGAVLSDMCHANPGQHKAEIKRSIAEHLGWLDLAADTKPYEWKFNIWYFHDPTEMRPREIGTRDVRLAIPVPAWHPNRRLVMRRQS